MTNRKLITSILMLAAAWISPHAKTIFLEKIAGTFTDYAFYYKDLGNGVFKVVEQESFKSKDHYLSNRYLYEYDSGGRIISSKEYTYASPEEGESAGKEFETSVILYNYDTTGKLASKSIKNYDRYTDKTTNTFTKYEYDTDGRLNAWHTYNGTDTSGNILNEASYTYGEDGYEIITSYPSTNNSDKSIYNSSGKLVEEISENNILKYVYDEKTGLPKFRLEYQSEEETPEDNKLVSVCTYSKVGNDYAVVQWFTSNGETIKRGMVKYDTNMETDVEVVMPNELNLVRYDLPSEFTMNYYRQFSKYPIEWTGDWMTNKYDVYISPLSLNPDKSLMTNYGDDSMITRELISPTIKYSYSETMPAK